MYDVTTGRWAQTDPEQYIDGPDLYEFVTDNPTARRDPTGLSGAASQPASQPTTLPGNVYDLLGPNGSLTKEFIDNFISSHNWGHSGPSMIGVPPYDPCGDGTFRPRVGINKRHDTLRIGNASSLEPGLAQTLQPLIDEFNEYSDKHETRMAQALKDIYCSCSKTAGADDWQRRLKEAAALSSISDMERNDLNHQLEILVQILATAGIPIPRKLQNDLGGS